MYRHDLHVSHDYYGRVEIPIATPLGGIEDIIMLIKLYIATGFWKPAQN